jgi:hypothetical protein
MPTDNRQPTTDDGFAMKRYTDWTKRLTAHLGTLVGKPFAWGSHDCALAAADAIVVMTGVDLAAEFRGKYTDQASAAAVIKNFAGGGLEELVVKVTAAHGMKEVGPRLAQRGDLVLFQGDQGASLGIVHMNGTRACSVGPKGMVWVCTLNCKRAWRVG